MKVQCEYSKNGYIIMNPMTEHSPFDFVAYKNGIFQRVQVKYRTMVKGKRCIDLRILPTKNHQKRNYYYGRKLCKYTII